MRNTAHPNLRFASLDMRGRLVFDVKGAIKAGVYDEEISAARALGAFLEAKRLAKCDEPIPYTITEAGRKALEDGRNG